MAAQRAGRNWPIPTGIAFDSADKPIHCRQQQSPRAQGRGRHHHDRAEDWGSRSRFPNQLNLLTSIVIDKAGNLYVVDSSNQRIQPVSAFGAIALHSPAQAATWRSTGRAICYRDRRPRAGAVPVGRGLEKISASEPWMAQ